MIFLQVGLQKGDYVIKKCVLFSMIAVRYNTDKEQEMFQNKMEVIIMALSNLFGWTEKNEAAPAPACGSACGAGDKPEEKPAACGSACGAGDK